MKWQQRVRVATGLSCWQIMLHLLVVAVLVMGWMSGALVRVGLGLCVLYGVTLLSMLFLQRHHEARWRDVGDFLEELTTTWYCGDSGGSGSGVTAGERQEPLPESLRVAARR